jgi:hypothetical protein
MVAEEVPLTTPRYLRIVSAAALVGGCYVRSPLSVPTPEPGTDVEVRLACPTDSAAPIGGGIAVFEGRALASGPDTLALAVRRTLRFDGMSTQRWNGERVALARADVAHVEQRQLSVVRSAILGAAVVTALVFAARAVINPSSTCGVGQRC